MREMFVTPHGAETKAEYAAAAALGLKYVESCMDRGEKVGVTGNTFECREKLKAAGFRWHGECKVWFVPVGLAQASFAKLAA